jgi:hypothetical protein
MDQPQPENLRADFDALVPFARRLYAEGKTANDVMRAVYGVDLPAEAYAFWKAFSSGKLELPLDWMHHPWELISAADPAYQDDPGRWQRKQQALALSQVPRFLPLMKLADDDAIHDDYIIGYDLDELRAGRTTIFGHLDDFPESGVKLVRLGDSLLGVLHEWMADHRRRLDAKLKSPANRGFGSIEDSDVEKVDEKLRHIEVLQKAPG